MKRVPKTEAPAGAPAAHDLEFFNGLGGFDAQGREYVTFLGPGQSTPAPWINVIANPHFGFQVAADGSGFTWALNSREHQITPWSNDPVADRPGEVLYLRDEETGEVWGPTAAPIREQHTYAYTAGTVDAVLFHPAGGERHGAIILLLGAGDLPRSDLALHFAEGLARLGVVTLVPESSGMLAGASAR